MSGEEILTAVLQDIFLFGKVSGKYDNVTIEDKLKTFDTFQRSALKDLLEAAADPEHYILAEDKLKIIRVTLQTMNEEQRATLYMLVGYAQAMFAH